MAPKLPQNATVYIVAPHEQFVTSLIPMTFFLLLLAFTDGTARTAEVVPRGALAELAVPGRVLALDNVGFESYVYDRSLPAFQRCGGVPGGAGQPGRRTMRRGAVFRDPRKLLSLLPMYHMIAYSMHALKEASDVPVVADPIDPSSSPSAHPISLFADSVWLFPFVDVPGKVSARKIEKKEIGPDATNQFPLRGPSPPSRPPPPAFSFVSCPGPFFFCVTPTPPHPFLSHSD